MIVTLGGGRLLARPVFRHIARTRLREIFTAFALLLVLVIALAFEHAGLSMALGAFLGGVLLAESEYRHEIEAAIEPFKGLLLGLFFIAVGMSADFAVLAARPWVVFGLIAGLFLVKGIVLWLIARHAGFPRAERPLFILLLAQGGEFAFVLLGVATGHGGLGTDAAPAITLAVAISMLLTPFLLALHDHLAPRFFAAPGEERAPDVPQASRVIVAGLGRVGQVVARMLHARAPADGAGRRPGPRRAVAQIRLPRVLRRRHTPRPAARGRRRQRRLPHHHARRSGRHHAPRQDRARAFPKLRVIARARDMRHMFALRDAGVEFIERETWLSALKLASSRWRRRAPTRSARRTAGDLRRARRQRGGQALRRAPREPDARIIVSNELRDQLARTLSEDERRIAEIKPGRP